MPECTLLTKLLHKLFYHYIPLIYKPLFYARRPENSTMRRRRQVPSILVKYDWFNRYHRKIISRLIKWLIRCKTKKGLVDEEVLYSCTMLRSTWPSFTPSEGLVTFFQNGLCYVRLKFRPRRHIFFKNSTATYAVEVHLLSEYTIQLYCYKL